MPKFEAMGPDEVAVGRGRAAAEMRKQYVAAIEGSDAGKVILDRADRASTVKRLLSEASKETGVRVRSSWADKSQRVLYWKRIGS